MRLPFLFKLSLLGLLSITLSGPGEFKREFKVITDLSIAPPVTVKISRATPETEIDCLDGSEDCTFPLDMEDDSNVLLVQYKITQAKNGVSFLVNGLFRDQEFPTLSLEERSEEPTKGLIYNSLMNSYKVFKNDATNKEVNDYFTDKTDFLNRIEFKVPESEDFAAEQEPSESDSFYSKFKNLFSVKKIPDFEAEWDLNRPLGTLHTIYLEEDGTGEGYFYIEIKQPVTQLIFFSHGEEEGLYEIATAEYTVSLVGSLIDLEDAPITLKCTQSSCTNVDKNSKYGLRITLRAEVKGNSPYQRLTIFPNYGKCKPSTEQPSPLQSGIDYYDATFEDYGFDCYSFSAKGQRPDGSWTEAVQFQYVPKLKVDPFERVGGHCYTLQEGWGGNCDVVHMWAEWKIPHGEWVEGVNCNCYGYDSKSGNLENVDHERIIQNRTIHLDWNGERNRNEMSCSCTFKGAGGQVMVRNTGMLFCDADDIGC